MNKLSQFAGRYASATIDKCGEINFLIKENDQMIVQLEQTFQIEKQVVEQQWQRNLVELQKIFNGLKLQLEAEVKDKDKHIL